VPEPQFADHASRFEDGPFKDEIAHASRRWDELLTEMQSKRGTLDVLLELSEIAAADRRLGRLPPPSDPAAE
jgi:hypothetical protein